MKKVEQYIFEVGDVFEGCGGGGGYIQPHDRSGNEILVSSHHHIILVGIDTTLDLLILSGGGFCEEFKKDTIIDHIKRGNLVYLGNIKRGNK